MKVPVTLHHLEHLVLSVFRILAISIGGCAVVSHCFSLHFRNGIRYGTSDMEHLIICYLPLCCVFKSSLDIMDKKFIRWLCKYFLLTCGLFSQFPDVFCTEVFNFNEVHLTNSLFHGSCLWCCI